MLMEGSGICFEQAHSVLTGAAVLQTPFGLPVKITAGASKYDGERLGREWTMTYRWSSSMSASRAEADIVLAPRDVALDQSLIFLPKQLTSAPRGKPTPRLLRRMTTERDHLASIAPGALHGKRLVSYDIIKRIHARDLFAVGAGYAGASFGQFDMAGPSSCQHVVIARMVSKDFAARVRHDEHILGPTSANAVGIYTGLEGQDHIFL